MINSGCFNGVAVVLDLILAVLKNIVFNMVFQIALSSAWTLK